MNIKRHGCPAYMQNVNRSRHVTCPGGLCSSSDFLWTNCFLDIKHVLCRPGQWSFRLSTQLLYCCYSKIWNSKGGKYFVWNNYYSRLVINRLSTNQLAAAWKTLTTAWTLWFSTDLYSHKLSEILVLSNTESVWGLALPIMITPSSSMRTMKTEWRKPSRHN